jgi:peroxiredoxin
MNGSLQALKRFADSWYAIGVIAVLVGFIAYQNSPRTPRAFASIGAQVPSFELTDLAGKNVHLDWSSPGRPSILYVFQPDCIWCKRNIEGEKALAGLSSHKFLAVSTTRTGLQEYADANRLPFPLFAMKDAGKLLEFTRIVTPLTMVVGINGKVQALIPGAFTEKSVPELEKILGLKLPRADLPAPVVFTPQGN